MRSRGGDYTTYKLSPCASWCDEKQLFICVVLPQPFLRSPVLWYWKDKCLLPCLFYKWLLSGKDVSEEPAWSERGWSIRCVERWEMEFFLPPGLPRSLPCYQLVNLEVPVLVLCRTWRFPWSLPSSKRPTSESWLPLLWWLWIVIAFLMMEHRSPVVCYYKMSHQNVV